jgi:hypothetical protein
LKKLIYSFIFIFLLPITSWAHRSGCHRWHSCPSDSGSYVCGDAGHPCRYGTTTIPVANAPISQTESRFIVETDIPISNDIVVTSKPQEDAIAPVIENPTVEAFSEPQNEKTESIGAVDGQLVLKGNSESLTAPIKNTNETIAPATDAVTMAQAAPEKIAVHSIDPMVIRKILKDHIPQFRYCYQNELNTSMNQVNLKGAVGMKFFIEADGKVSNSEIKSNDLTLERVHKCMESILVEIQFPAPKGGGTVEVNQPFNLLPRKM